MKPQNKVPHLTPNEELVMIALADRELYGLDIAKAISEASQGTRSLRCGSLYPLVHGLERKNFVVARWGDEELNERGGARRRYYKATPQGIQAIAEVADFRRALGGWGKG
jgi:PadR family transcriptional regulator, regulatory protein PadR